MDILGGINQGEVLDKKILIEPNFFLKGQYGSKSDVWSFGVTLWEILTFAREQPYEQLSDREILANLQELADTGI